MILRGFHRGRLAGAELLVYFEKSFLGIFGGILFVYGLAYALVLAEHIDYIVIGALSESADKGCGRDLAVFVYADIEHVVAVHFVFQPRASVGYNGGLKQLLAGFVVIEAVVNAG